MKNNTKKKAKAKVNNKKKTTITMVIVIGIVIALFTIGTIICAICYGDKKHVDPNENYLKTYVSKFYEDDYYLSTSVEDIKNFKDTGVTVNLESLERLVDAKFDIDCNLEKSTVTIYPKDPFGKKDYRITYNLECNK